MSNSLLNNSVNHSLIFRGKVFVPNFDYRYAHDFRIKLLEALILFLEAVLIALLGIVILIYNGTSYYRFLVEMAIFGGLIFAVYPVAVARANDVFEGRDAVPVSSALLLCYSIGAVSGPILASTVMALLKSPYGLYVYWSLVSGAFAAVTLYLKLRERITVVPVPEQVNFVPLKNTSSVALVLDPRTDASGEKEKN